MDLNIKMMRATHKQCILLILGILAFLSYFTDMKNIRKYVAYKESDSRVIIAFGDSLTRGFYSEVHNDAPHHPYTIKLQELIDSYIREKRSMLNIEVKNYGVNGEKVTKTMKKRMKRLLEEQRVDLAVILAGTNDLVAVANNAANYSGPDRILNDLHALHLICHYNGVATAALTIPETLSDVHEVNGTLARARRFVNRELSQFARVNANRMNLTLIDISRKIPRRNNSHLWDDGLHFTPQGYEYIGELVFDGIKNTVSQWIIDYGKYF